MKKDYKWIYLPVEIRIRELDSKLLLAYYLAKNGFNVILGEHVATEFATRTLPKGIFFSKGYPNAQREKVLAPIVKSGHRVVELDEEGLLIENSSSYIEQRGSYDSLSYIDQIYCWGDIQFQALTKSHQSISRECHVTGNPRFDLLSQKYRELYRENANRIKEKYGDYILINTRFSEYNHLTRLKKSNSGTIQNYIKKLYQSMIELVHELSYSYNQIIIRPHPTENANSYIKTFYNTKNVHVITQGQPIPWLMASQVVIHNGCTTGIEAQLLDQPVISYVPFQDARYDIELPNSMGVQAKSIEQVKQLINHYATKKRSNKALQKYYDLSPSCAYDKILNHLDAIPLSYNSSETLGFKKIKYNRKKYRYRFRELSIDEITQFFELLNVIEGQIEDFTINQLDHNLFQIYK